MKYDFETVIDRLHSDSIKWHVKENELPMWIADMDFKVAPEIIEAMEERVKHGVFGYCEPDENWKDAYVSFYKDRHALSINKDWLLFSEGVVPTISSSVRKLTSVGDQVVVLSPVYTIFYNSIINNGRIVRQVPLLFKDNAYSIDWKGLEEAFKEEKTTLMILCNPANPISKIWTKEELSKIGFLARKYGVVVLSDEIHGEITRPGTSYVPYLSADKENAKMSVIAVSPTKCFNLASLHSSAVIVPDLGLRKRVDRQLNTDEVAEPSTLAIVGAEAALNEGRAWLDEMREKVFENRDEAKEFLTRELPEVTLVDSNATYLLWLNISKVASDSTELLNYLREKTGLILSDGKAYGGNGSHFLRMNVACPTSLLEDGLERLKKGIKSYLSEKK